MRQYSGHFYGPLSMSAIISDFSRYLSNTAKSEKTNNLIDDPDRDVISLLKRIISLGMLLINHDAGHMLKFV